MNSRERVLRSLNHKEPDRVPFDISGSNVSGIAIHTYKKLLQFYGKSEEKSGIQDLLQQLSQPSDHFLDFWKVDTRGLIPAYYANIPLPVEGEVWKKTHRKQDGYLIYTDEWGVEYRFKEGEDFYYSQLTPLLEDSDLDVKDVQEIQFPKADAPWRFAGLDNKGKKYIEEGKIVLLKSVNSGFQETSVKIRGMQNFMMDLALNKKAAEALLDRILEYKITYWKEAFHQMDGNFDIAIEADDYGSQESLLFSPDMFRELFKPRLKTLFSFIKSHAPGVKIFFHSCGAIRPLIPDLIEVGVDILNPVHIAARGMNPYELKKEYGKDLTFWGGGVETQDILPNGSIDDVIKNVRQNIDALSRGGGWVFSPIHNIQADVPPENLDAMQKTLMEYGKYN